MTAHDTGAGVLPYASRLWNRIALILPPAAAVCSLAAFLFAVSISFGWPFVHDAPLIHYVVFLMDHGRAPYRDIVEMNMPGTYMMDWSVIHVLGGGARAWWVWDLMSGFGALFACAWILGPQRRAAGITAGVLAYLSHLRGGPTDLGQRDWIVAVLLLFGTGCLFAQIRENRPAWMAGLFGFSMIAALIKPPVLFLAILFFFAACLLARRSGRPILPLMAWASLGAIVPALAAVAFLWHWGVAKQFLETARGLVPWYAGLGRTSLAQLVHSSMASLSKPLLAATLLLFLGARSWRRWEAGFLIAGLFGGAALFIGQGKGWNYHLGVEMAFMSLWTMFEIQGGLQVAGWKRIVAAVALVGAVGWTLPRDIRAQRSVIWPVSTISRLKGDLDSLGGPQLSGHIQCLDMTLGGCINVLYQERLVQSTGFIYDFYLFPKHGNQVTQALQARFLSEMNADRPRVIVLSSHIWPGDGNGYEELANWPIFQPWLDQYYRLLKEQPGDGSSGTGYRIYLER